MLSLTRMLSKQFVPRTSFNTLTKRQLSDESRKALERSINHVQLLGRVGNDPQKRGSETHPVVVFSLATNSSYQRDGEIQRSQLTDWHRITVFKPSLRELVFNYLKKGQRVFVTGRIKYSELMDEDKTSYYTSIIAEDIIFLRSSNEKSD